MLTLYIIGIINLIVQPINAICIIELIVHRSSTTFLTPFINFERLQNQINNKTKGSKQDSQNQLRSSMPDGGEH